jgi:cephalosporin-C deacetylase-like acetyl esterase
MTNTKNDHLSVWVSIRPFRKIVTTTFFGLFSLSVSAQTTQGKSEAYLRETLEINIPKDHRHAISRRVSLQDSTWLDWQKRTGELPPDFSQMSSAPFLPEPLEQLQNGHPISIRTINQWKKKREEIKNQFQHWISGNIPPPPNNLVGQILSDHTENGTHIQLIELRFGPEGKAKMTFELMIPEGEGPFPVYMTQWTHRNWAQLAVRRGYIGCVYAASDEHDDTQAYQALYPQYDFTCLMRRAWGASRVVDYLLTCPEINQQQIAITGHSRNGKQSLWAAAFDERISAVISSSCGTGGVTPWRYSDPQYCDQTIDDICSNAAHWFHPRLRFFFGREDKLPIDQNLLLSLIAPRGLLLHYAVMERQLNTWATEQCYHSVKKVYDFLEAGDQIGLFPRMGEHAVAARDVERCIDFLDLRFKRHNIPWQNILYFDYTFAGWSKEHKHDYPESQKIEPVFLNNSAFAQQKDSIQKRIKWLLGKEPARVKPLEVTPTTRIDWMDGFTGRPVVGGAEIVQLGPYTAMGDHLAGMLYLPQKRSGKVPAVIYLHQYAYAHGFASGYNQEGNGKGNSDLFKTLIDNGLAVIAIDLFGCGTRMQEAQYFYQRFPQWSKMGKMVSDVKACVDALETFEFIDSGNIFVLGNTLGGSIGLIAAAQDERIAGIAAIAAFSPWRTSNSQYESIRNFSHQHGLIPRLGWYAEKPEKVPIDWDEILSYIAPRPLMIIAPSLDRYTDPKAIQRTVSRVRNRYERCGAPENLKVKIPMEINRMTTTMNQDVTQFFKRIIEKKIRY